MDLQRERVHPNHRHIEVDIGIASNGAATTPLIRSLLFGMTLLVPLCLRWPRCFWPLLHRSLAAPAWHAAQLDPMEALRTA